MAGSKMFRPKAVMGRQAFPGSDGSSAAALNRQFNQTLGEVMGNLNDFVRHMEGVSPDILADALEPTFGKAIDYCPKETHALVNSAFLETERFRGGARAIIGFGRGGNPTYAIYVHEMPYNHEAPTRSKFLEAAVDEDLDDIQRRIPAIVRGYAGT